MPFQIEDIVHESARESAKAFECSVCLCLWDEPVQTPCHHIYCKDCVAPVMACPLCKLSFGGKTGAVVCQPLTTANQFVARMFHNVEVVCPNHGGGDGAAQQVVSSEQGRSLPASPSNGAKRRRIDGSNAGTKVTAAQQAGSSAAAAASRSAEADAPDSHEDVNGSTKTSSEDAGGVYVLYI